MNKMLLLSAAMVVGLSMLLTPVSAADEAAELREKALKLNNITGDEALKGTLQELIKTPTSTTKLVQAAAKMAKEKEQPFQVNATLLLAQAAHSVKEYEAAETFYGIHLKQSTELASVDRLTKAYIGLSMLMYEMKKYAECEKLCEEFLGLPLRDDAIVRAKTGMLRRYVMAQSKQGKGEDALKLVDKLIKDNPKNWLLVELKANVQRDSGMFEEAVKTYEDLLDRIKNDKEFTKEERSEFTNEIRYLLSNVYVELREIDKAAEHLKALLVDDPDNPTFNNDLGYIWADHDKNLEESLKLIQRAIDEDRKQRKKSNPDLKPEDDKDNSSYLDSLGWVLYKLKKYDDARKHLEQAVQDKEGQHLEIFDHLGDVYLALGQKNKAVESWKKGLEFTSTSKRDQTRKANVEKKIKSNE